MNFLAHAAQEAFRRGRHLADTLRQSRSPFALAPFSVEASEDIASAIDSLIQARIAERDEVWIRLIREQMAAQGVIIE